MTENIKRKSGVSPELDELSSELLGNALDLLAETGEVPVLLVCECENGSLESFEFEDDGPEVCLEAARSKVSNIPGALRYAIIYEGAIEDEDGVFVDALILEFGEKGWRSYSAFTLVSGKGCGEDFTWSDPAPAGELEPLL